MFVPLHRRRRNVIMCRRVRAMVSTRPKARTVASTARVPPFKTQGRVRAIVRGCQVAPRPWARRCAKCAGNPARAAPRAGLRRNWQRDHHAVEGYPCRRRGSVSRVPRIVRRLRNHGRVCARSRPFRGALQKRAESRKKGARASGIERRVDVARRRGPPLSPAGDRGHFVSGDPITSHAGPSARAAISARRDPRILHRRMAHCLGRWRYHPGR